MGYSIQRLNIIKAKLIGSDPNDLKSLFKFLEDQLNNRESVHSEVLEISTIRRMFENLESITLKELEEILDYVIEQIPMCRIADRANRVLDEERKEELMLLEYDYFSRELRYSKLEKFIFTLTSIE